MWWPLLSSSPLASSLNTSLLAYLIWCSASRKMNGKAETASGGERRPAKLGPAMMVSTVPRVRPRLMCGFLAERGGREHLHLVAAVGAPFDLVAGPHRVFVKRFRCLVDMGPLELGL